MTVLDRIFSLGRSIWSDRHDLHDEHQSPESLGFWVWLMSEGLEAYPELRELVPIPPRKLINRVVGDSSDEFFQSSGLDEASYLFMCLTDGGFDPARGGAMLDFGCGCGRIMRIMARFGDSVELHGADIDAAAIDWCRRNLDYAQFEVLPGRPPSTYPDGKFGAVYVYSVFTHLSESQHRMWLEELHRVTAPGAVLVLTTAGRSIVQKVLAGSDRLKIPTLEQMQQDAPALEEGGFAFYPYGFSFKECPDETAAENGMTFFYEQYVRENWLDLFELVAFREAPTDWQDYVILRRP